MIAPDLQTVLYTGAIGLVVIGAIGLVMSGHLFRIILALTIAEAGANLLLVLAGYRWDAVAPIFSTVTTDLPMVDPVPQAMVLTAIVIGVGIQALAVAILLRIRREYGTLEMAVLRQRMEADIANSAGVPLPGSQEEPDSERPLPEPGVIPAGELRS